MDSPDPLGKITVEEIKALPESEYRIYSLILHNQLVRGQDALCRKVDGVKIDIQGIHEDISRRPERVRANMALGISIIMMGVSLVAFIWTVTRGG